ncbi:dihydrodipicolinate reductase [Synechococcus sp. 63AY4M2]|nr:dihydrodipicolinate reductase [Synechococcus sp. 63AY4M2]PIK88455.1 dihydrodipicolinate reductase [Synechococcus sp. 65AY6A5]PIK92887.1 dihydrodipicolinate reductase [Synechococcus sp. 65AY6Li]PIK94247.1 dihydrodipicolinate reductase [Synechococcus sp. 60AY4M2]PIK98829.1 dihydrodipicolinate reductase [Synechococcus sp. 63AY4M1]PIK99347.1 dihydrodipicolinate reductase [Synechococcus sp. 65AY640]
MVTTAVEQKRREEGAAIGEGTAASEPIPVLVVGALGKMGREVVRAVAQTPDMKLVGAVARSQLGSDIGEVLGLGSLGVEITDDLAGQLLRLSQRSARGVMVDFTHPRSVYENVRSAIAFGVRPVVGTTGLTPEQVERLRDLADKSGVGCLIAPNFAIGMILLQQMALQAAQYFDHVEIVELHHNRKVDAPSGTALQTAQRLGQLGKAFNPPEVEEKELIPGSRGGIPGPNIPIHSVRLPGLIAHQEVIFGGMGQTLTLRHDITDRMAFMPGVILGIRKVLQLKGLVYGLEQVLS